MNPRLKEITAQGLLAAGYDGLFGDWDCACSLDDLMPCDEPRPSCEAGYLAPCDCGEHEFHVCRTRRE